MKELKEIINKKVESMISDGTIQKKIEEGIEQSIERSIESLFGSYGHLTKQIEKGMEEGLQLNIKELPFEVYNQQMMVAVKSKIGNMFQGEAAQKFMLELDKTLAPVPKEITITELVNSIAKIWREQDNSYDDILDDAEVVFELDEKYNWYKLEMKKESGSGWRNGLHLHIPDGTIRISHNQNYNPTCFDEAESFVFKLYSAGTKITGLEDFDECECDLTLKVDEYY